MPWDDAMRHTLHMYWHIGATCYCQLRRGWFLSPEGGVTRFTRNVSTNVTTHIAASHASTATTSLYGSAVSRDVGDWCSNSICSKSVCRRYAPSFWRRWGPFHWRGSNWKWLDTLQCELTAGNLIQNRPSCSTHNSTAHGHLQMRYAHQ